MLHVDPTGNDVWKINENGEIVAHEITEDYDRFVIVNDDGSAKSITNADGETVNLELTFEYGTV